MNNYKDTLNLPKTTFSMKGNLTEKEPKILKQWNIDNLYQLIRKKKENKKIFFLHDGPPYANGNIHIGHAVNKILKDIIVKSKNMSGFDAPYIPSWDCHGLPIEQKVEEIIKKRHIKKISTSEFQNICRQYANKQVQKQKKDFIRLGVLGDWKNAHLTMNFKNEADIIRSLALIMKKKYIYQDFKPTYWCTKCTSSLSEAEIEYRKKQSDSIIVSMQSKNTTQIKKLFNKKILKNKKIYFPIWTTTPWTLPSSKAIAVHEQAQYQLIETETCYFILAEKLIQNVFLLLKIRKWKVLNSILGKYLEYANFSHPFLKDVYLPVILSDHVTLKSGTGAVHTAPDHGQDDYIASQKYKIKTSNLVDSQGNYTNNIHPKLNGLNVFQANSIIIKLLIENNCLLHHSLLKHNYPHCWRHKTPTIHRATSQWFIDINKYKLREKTLKEIQNVIWMPSWGKTRINDMVKIRPDWCISRQRKWGVPMSIFINKKTGTIHPKTFFLMEKIAQKVELEGIETWNHFKLQKYWNEDCGMYKKVSDILDVWFESGNTHTSINYTNKKYAKQHADMYLEGSDQYRGWFMSSLIISMLKSGKTPYSEVLTHGFVVDIKGQKMSKSVGNTISPNNVIDTLGADVLRLWVASSNYSNDISISNEILKRSSETYRRIRNTARFMLANIYDFYPDKHIVIKEKMILLDQWAVDQAKMTQEEIIKSYKKYDFHTVIKQLMYFCSITMGSFYLDIIKDRQYTLKKNSKERRSCQTAMYYIIHALVRWIAPILSFTADEIWQHIPGNHAQYVFTEEWFDKLFNLNPNHIFNQNFWNKIIELKNETNKFLEMEIKNKRISHSLEACIILYVVPELKNQLERLGKEIKFIFLTSEVKIKSYDTAPTNAQKSQNVAFFKIFIEKATKKKCQRCWHYTVHKNNTSIKTNYICTRCITNTIGNGETRSFI